MHPGSDQDSHGVGMADQPDERLGDAEVEAPVVLQAPVVGLQGQAVPRGERFVQGLGCETAGLVGVGDAFAVERVDGAARVAGDEEVRSHARADREAHRKAPTCRGTTRRLG